jgi:hypothetical protein
MARPRPTLSLIALAALAGLAGLPALAVGQGQLPEEATAEEIAAYRELQAARRGYERELRKIRADFFLNIRGTEVRQIGMRKLRTYTDPAAFPLLTELFFPEGADVRDAILDHLAVMNTAEADAAIAWEAVYNEDPDDRFAAQSVLERLDEERGLDPMVVDVLRSGLREPDEGTPIEAARVAASLNLYELIPLMAQAQVAARGGGERRGDLAWITIGTQRAFVSDVTPVVADGAVAFDPQLSVVSEGVILRVSDAFVAIYRVELHGILVGMTSEAWGQPTGHLGYDPPAWGRWYREEFQPFLEAKAAAEAEAKATTDSDADSEEDAEPQP